MGRYATRRKPGNLPNLNLITYVFGRKARMKEFIFSILFLFLVGAKAQETSMDSIEEVHIVARFSPSIQCGYTVIEIKDKVLMNENQNLTHLLRKYSNAYIKEQGSGMVASISMRGTGASHTGVYWNGIPINSSLNGQTDFNTISPTLYNKISIKKGGSSTLLGSGAIGGAVNLENTFYFNKGFEGNSLIRLAAFDTYAISANAKYSTDKVALQVGIGGVKSKNDYRYLGTDLYNKNGEIRNNSTYLGLAYRPNIKQQLYFKTLLSDADRNTSGTLFSESNAKLLYKTKAFLGGYHFTKATHQLHLKSSYLTEVYNYLYHQDIPSVFSENKSENFLQKADYTYSFSNDIKLLSGFSYENSKGEGMNIKTIYEDTFAFYTWLHHKLTDKVAYNISARKEWTEQYEIPVVISFDSRINWNEKWQTKLNASTNYRTPTFNDLYWQPGGNSDLEPEKSSTLELWNKWTIATNLGVGVAVFATKSANLIQWQPVTSTFWQPFNIQDVSIRGLELEFDFRKKIGNYQLALQTQYSYTISQDEATEKQLIYVPYSMGNTVLDYSYKKWHLSYDINYTGKAYTTTTNTQFMDAYWVSNAQFSVDLFKKKFNLALRINNLFNKSYQVVSSRPMPGRNHSISVGYSF